MANEQGVLALHKAGQSSTSGTQASNNHITGRVLYTLLTDDATKLKEMNVPPGSVGAIQFSIVSTSKKDEKNFAVAFPLNPIGKYPIQNELVNIVAGPSKQASNPVGANVFSWYYDNIHSIFDSPEHNALPSDATYNNLGSKSVTGDLFTERGDVHKLQHLPGDVIIEGRFGNSIRFGASNNLLEQSPWKGKQGNPVVVITNGQRVQTEKNISAVFEDINMDGSTIWMLNGHNITFVPASTNFNSYGSNNTSVEQKNNIVTSTVQVQPTTEESLQKTDIPTAPIVDVPSPVYPTKTETQAAPAIADELQFLPDKEEPEYFQELSDIEVGEVNYTIIQSQPPIYKLTGSSKAKTSNGKLLYNKEDAIAGISKGKYPELPLLPFKSTVFTIKEVADTLNSIRRENPTKVNLQLVRSVLATAINEQGGAKLKGFNYDFFGIQADIGTRWAFGPIFTGLSFSGQVIALEGATKSYRVYLAFASLSDSLKYTIDALQRKGFSGIPLTPNDASEYAKLYIERWNSPDNPTPAYIASKSSAYTKAKQYIN